MSEPKIRVEMLYGLNAARHAVFCQIVAPPDPTAADILRGTFRELVIPAFLFALAVTALKSALLGHF